MSVTFYSLGDFFYRKPLLTNDNARWLTCKEDIFNKKISCYSSLEEWDISLEDVIKIKQNNNGRSITKTLIEKGVKCISPIVIDIDALTNGERKRQDDLLAEVKKLAFYLMDNLELVYGSDFRVDWSGFKGAHFIIPHKVFGGEFVECRPGFTSNKLAYNMAEEIIRCSNVAPDIVDRSSQYSDRLMRSGNSKHNHTDFYCTPLTLEEITNCSWEAISEIANVNNAQYRPVAMATKGINPKLGELYEKHRKRYCGKVLGSKSKPPESFIFNCACISYYIKNVLKLYPDNFNRFTHNLPFAIAAFKIGGKETLYAFHSEIALSLGHIGPEDKGAEWTSEIISSIQNYKHACISGKNEDGEYLVGTKSILKDLSEQDPNLPHFECNPGCPLSLARKARRFAEFIKKIADQNDTSVKNIFVDSVFEYLNEMGYLDIHKRTIL